MSKKCRGFTLVELLVV
ncbi:MAG: type II secretion system protein, partial [Pirellula sp.]